MRKRLAMCLLHALVSVVVLGVFGTGQDISVTPVYYEGFVSPSFCSWDAEHDSGARSWVADGAYNVIVETARSRRWWLGDHVADGDYLLEVDVTVLKRGAENRFGLLFNCADNDDFYVFWVSCNGYASLARYADGTLETVVEPKRCYLIRLGQARNHLSVAVQGSQVACYVNGGKVIDIATDCSLSGRIGLAVGTEMHPGCHVAFDNVTVSAVAVAEK